MTAMIFAAGLGTRLRPLTNDRPKALVEVEGRSLLEHNILKLREAGFDHIIINVHHFGDQIIDFIKAKQKFGIDIRISDERMQLLDTGGGIKHAIPLFTAQEPVLVHNVDIISDIDLRSLYLHHVDFECRTSRIPGATLAINQRQTSRYLMFDKAMDLCGWTNISTGEVRGSIGEKYAFSGIHVISPNLFPYLINQPQEAFPIISFYMSVCQELSLNGYDVTANQWVDCGKPESLLRAAQIIK